MAYEKGERIEPGIWRLRGSKEYLAEVNLIDPESGKRIRERKTSNRLDLARHWRQARKTDSLRGQVSLKKHDQLARPFDTYAQEYLKNWSKVEKQLSSYARDCNSLKHLVRFLGKKDIKHMKRRDVESYVAQRKGSAAKPGTINRELSCLKNMLRKAVDWEYIDSNPAWGVRQQREEIQEFEFLRETEIADLIDACPQHLAPIVKIALNTGMRRGEILGLTWDCVGFDKGEKGIITVRNTKNHENRHIPMNEVARSTLRRHPKRIVNGSACPFVFSNSLGDAVRSVRNGFDAAVKRAGIGRHIRFHDLRHTFASHLVMKGVDIRTVANLMGHKDIRVTMRYSHLAPDHLQAAVDVLTSTERFESLKSGTDS